MLDELSGASLDKEPVPMQIWVNNLTANAEFECHGAAPKHWVKIVLRWAILGGSPETFKKSTGSKLVLIVVAPSCASR